MAGAAVVDWPVGYAEPEPYYAQVEHEVRVSGRVADRPFAEPRSTPDFPFPPTRAHPVADWLDTAATDMGLHPFPVPRAILPGSSRGHKGCAYSGYCGS